MVKTTTSEAVSAVHASIGKSAPGRVRGKGRQGFSFAAILEKALNGPAAPEKAGKAKGTFRAAALLDTKNGTTPEESLQRPEKHAKKTEKRNLPLKKLREESSVPRAEIQAEERVTQLAQAVAQPALVPARETREDAEISSPKAVFHGASLSAQDSAAEESLTAAAGPAIPAQEGSLKAGDKTKPGAEKKLSAKEETAEPRRKENFMEAAKTENADEAVLAREGKPSSPEEAKQETPRQEIEIRVALRAVDERFDDTLRTVEERGVKETASGLLRRLREDANSDIVRSARFILKDHNEGEIRLVLKPESLGEVKIRISLQDNLIGGRIFVENENVRAVFEQNMPELASAFKENGMELGSLNVSVGNDGSREKAENPGGLAAYERAPIERETLVSSAEAGAYYFISHTVNVMA